MGKRQSRCTYTPPPWVTWSPIMTSFMVKRRRGVTGHCGINTYMIAISCIWEGAPCPICIPHFDPPGGPPPPKILTPKMFFFKKYINYYFFDIKKNRLFSFSLGVLTLKIFWRGGAGSKFVFLYFLA